ncbi:MAG: prepilin-type N-terminal cleavage/methylation domain-containing protein [Verrucomicrobiales bacterium]|nr:prepilin-type N-terminal cleavage/methylation domain-containing protein [Verrucomicrobiales bacterium]
MCSKQEGRCLVAAVDRPTRKGFTLVELLVVIAILAILASLLLPGLARAKQAAKSALCRSHLRQWGITLALYLDDFARYPSGEYARTNMLGAGVVLRITPATSVEPSDDEEGIRRCPTHSQQRLTDGYFTVSGWRSYGYNEFGYISATGLPGEGHHGLSLRAEGGVVRAVGESEVRAPSEMIAIGDNLALLPRMGNDLGHDAVWESPAGLMRQESAGARGSFTGEAVRRAAARHSNRGNIVFCDGHVESVPFRRLFLERDDASLRRWNRDHEPHR